MYRCFPKDFSKLELCVAIKLINEFISSIDNIFDYYIKLYDDADIFELMKIKTFLQEVLIKINKSNNRDEIQSLVISGMQEERIKKYTFRCWKYEISDCGGGYLISWFKQPRLFIKPKAISCTLIIEEKCQLLTYCNSRYGISYSINIDSFLGAKEKDASVLIQKEKPSVYTIGLTEDKETINSYNLATATMPPQLTLNQKDNIYRSKHNEIVLDGRYAEPKSVIYFDESDLEIVNKISEELNLPIEKLSIENFRKGI